jgi:hypothetical protein
LDGVGEQDVVIFVFEAVYYFDLAFCHSTTDVDAKRDSGEIGVLEFDSRPLVAVVQQHV